MNLAIIPARAGSKGVPGKNTRLINNRPLVSWSIEAALSCPQIDAIVVTSNCPEVSRIVHGEFSWDDDRCRHKVFCLPRPEEISGDKSKTEDALVHAVDWAVTQMAWEPERVVLLQPTSPVRNNGLITKCLEAVNSGDFDSLLTCSSHTPFFYHRREDGLALFADWNPCHRPMRQDIPPIDMMYHDNGNVYVTDTHWLVDAGCRVGRKPYVYETTPYQSWQIDYPEDFQILEAMSKTFGSFV
jgi:CMP-N,N'-diacetyllegionaminic acid synthase